MVSHHRAASCRGMNHPQQHLDCGTLAGTIFPRKAQTEPPVPTSPNLWQPHVIHYVFRKPVVSIIAAITTSCSFQIRSAASSPLFRTEADSLQPWPFPLQLARISSKQSKLRFDWSDRTFEQSNTANRTNLEDDRVDEAICPHRANTNVRVARL